MGDMIKFLFYARKSKTNSEGNVPVYREWGNVSRQQLALLLESPCGLRSVARVLVVQMKLKELHAYLDGLRTKAFDILKRINHH